MSDNNSLSRIDFFADSFARDVKIRIRTLVLLSSLAVAIVFGLTFYFALLANESAMARQVPELAQVAAKLRGLLVMNTLVFVAIIIASFFALASIVTSGLFRPLGALHQALLSIAGAAIPRPEDLRAEGPFAALAQAFNAAAAHLRDLERKEAAELESLADELEADPAAAPSGRKIREYLKRRTSQRQDAAPSTREEPQRDPLFIQPL